MRANPGADCLLMCQDALSRSGSDGTCCCSAGATPLQELDGDGAHRTPLDKAQPDGLRRLWSIREQPLPLRTQQHAITGERFRIRIGGRDPLFHSRNGCSTSVQVCRVGCSWRLHHTSSAKPSRQSGCWAASGSAGRVGFFSAVLRIGAGNPVFGPFPALPQAQQRLADGLAADAGADQPVVHTDLGG